MEPKGKSCGYSLLEMLIVLTLLAGTSLFILVQIPHDIREEAIEVSATRLMADLRETQQAAIASHTWHTVKFFASTNEYKIYKAGTFIRSVSLMKGVRFSNQPAELMFLPTGSPSVGMTIYLKVDQSEKKVIVAPIMGRIRLQ